MRIREITVTRVKNLGNYENQKNGMTAVLDEGEDPVQAAIELEDRVRQTLGQPTRGAEAAQKVVRTADAQWAQARHEARMLADKEANAASLDGKDQDEADHLRKVANEWRADYEKSVALAEAEEQKPEVRAARATLGQKPKTAAEVIDLDKLRATAKAEAEANRADDEMPC